MKYDIMNPLPCNRVIHDANKRAVMIPSRGGRVRGIELEDGEAERLITLAKKLKEGQELVLTESADQGEAAKQSEPNKNPKK